MKFIIYGLIDPITLMIRYVGLSATGMRRPKSHRNQRNSSVDTYCARWVRNLIQSGLEYEIAVLEECGCVDQLPQAERWWIAYGRASGWPLTNLTDGGEGLINPSARTRLKISEAVRKRMATPESKQRARETALRLFSSDEARQAISIRNRAFMLQTDVREANRERARSPRPMGLRRCTCGTKRAFTPCLQRPCA